MKSTWFFIILQVIHVKRFLHIKYIKKLLEELSADMQGLATTPASSYLFNTDPGCQKLSKEWGQ